MGLFGSSASINTSEQRISAFQVNQSSYGTPLKLIFGTSMVNCVLIDYMDFTAIAHTTTTESGGKGGGGATQTNTTYTYTVAISAALGEGELAGVGQVWLGSKVTDMGAMNMIFFDGKKKQAPWGYMLEKHPDHALTYSGTSYFAGVADLGNSASLPNMNFEVYGLCQSKIPSGNITIAAHNDVIVTPAYNNTLYKLNTTFTLDNYKEMISITTTPDIKKRLKYTVSVDSNHVATVHAYTTDAAKTRVKQINVVYSHSNEITVSNQKMQQFSYNKEIEISNFASNRYVQEYIFDPVTATGSWVTLNSRFYKITQAKDPYDNPRPGVYLYTFNFDDRDDGYDRADPTYIRIYYKAIQATVDYMPTDANPRDIIWTLLTSTVYGENFPDVLIDEESLAAYSDYCKTNQLLISPVYGDQTSCSDIINGLMECTNSAYVFSQGKAKIIPYWDGLPANYAINDKNIIDQEDETLRIERTSQADTYNIIPLEHTSRADQYNSNVVYATDEGDIELHGVRQAGTYSHLEIMNQSLAQAVAQLILQKQLYNRNRYTVKLGQEFVLLEPMDAVTLESQLAGLGITSVRVVEITESQEDFTLEITFEDNLSGISTAPNYATQDTSRTEADTNAYPDDVNTLVLFEAPTPLVESATGYEVWIYASGQNEFWGGCNIWISSDNESYKMIGSVEQPARQGIITENVPVYEDSLKIDVSDSRCMLNSVSQEAFDTYETISWISGAGNGEFLAYKDAELTAQYQYNVSTLHRGLYGSTTAAHTAGATFVRCDRNTVLKYPFNAKDIGTKVYVKATSFNVFKTVEQALSDVEPVEFTIVGYNQKTIIETGKATIDLNVPKRINYKNVFSAAPAPQVTITDALEGDLLQIENMTETGFDCYFTNPNIITPNTRKIDYLVTGV